MREPSTIVISEKAIRVENTPIRGPSPFFYVTFLFANLPVGEGGGVRYPSAGFGSKALTIWSEWSIHILPLVTLAI